MVRFRTPTSTAQRVTSAPCTGAPAMSLTVAFTFALSAGRYSSLSLETDTLRFFVSFSTEIFA